MKTKFLLSLCMFFCAASFGQQKKMTLNFDVNGRLISGYSDKFKLSGTKKCLWYKRKGCSNNKNLKVNVEIPVSMLLEDFEKLYAYDSLYKLQRDNSDYFLCQLFNCQKKKDSKLTIPASCLPDSSVQAYFDYLQKLKTANSKTDITKFPPDFRWFNLKVVGKEISNECITYTYSKTGGCECVNDKSGVVTMTFSVPPNLLKDKYALDSFELIRNYPLKSKAINFYNNLLETYSSKISLIKKVDENVRNYTKTLKDYVTVIEKLKAINDDCKKDTGLKKEYNDLLAEFSKNGNTISKLIDIKNCTAESLCCDTVFLQWYFKTWWITGGEFKFNPFPFTNDEYIESQVTFAKNKEKEKALVFQKEMKRKAFWDTAYTHLRDSILLSRRYTIQEASKILDTLLQNIDTININIDKNEPATVKNNILTNQEKRKVFTTTSLILNKGWFNPYILNNNQLILRLNKTKRKWSSSYYYDQNPMQDKDPIEYLPESERLTVLLHNVPLKKGVNFKINAQSFTDEQPFTSRMGELVEQVGSLYKSLVPLSAGLSAIVKSLINPKSESMISNVIPYPTSSTFAPETKIPKKATDDFLKKNKLPKNSKIAISTAPELFQIDSIYSWKSEMITARIPRNNMKDSIVYFKPDISALYLEIKKYSLEKQKDSSFWAEVLINTIDNFPDSLSPFQKLKKVDSLEQALQIIQRPCLNSLKAFIELAGSEPFINKKITFNNDSIVMYRTIKQDIVPDSIPRKMEYNLNSYAVDSTNKVETNLVKEYVYYGKLRRVFLTAGLGYTRNAGYINEVDTTGGNLNISRNNDKVRLMFGLKIFPWGLYNQKNPEFIFKDYRWLHRISLLLAAGVPKPLENIYAGIGIDMVPGLTVSGGYHFQQSTSYTIIANRVKDSQTKYASLLFTSISLDPELLIKALKSIIK